ncbi:MAG: HD domain-containing protein [Candidatus Omnitrophota bacterium]
MDKGLRLLDLISEAGMLKYVKRSGWSVLGIKDGESVAEHSFRCSVLGYVIAGMEGVFPYKIMVMTLFNDIHEARIGDLHKMSQRYIDPERIEDKAFYEQIQGLPKAIKSELKDMREEYRQQKSRESIIARDADILECLIQAREYYIHGFKEAVKFTKKAPSFLKTKSAKKLWSLAKNSDINSWWEKLSTFKR